MKRLRALVCILTCVLFPSSVSAADTMYRDPAGRFTIPVPEGWETLSSHDARDLTSGYVVGVSDTEDIAAGFTPDATKAFSPLVLVATISMNADEDNDEAFDPALTEREILAQIASDLQDVRDLIAVFAEEEDAAEVEFINSLRVKSFHRDLAAKNFTVEYTFETEVTGLVYFVTHTQRSASGTDLDLLFLAREDDYEDMQPTFQMMMDGFTVSATAATDTTAFIDVPRMHPYFDAVEALREAGVMSGYDPTHFGPDNSLTRAELLKVGLNASNKNGTEYGIVNPYTDIQTSHSLYPYILYAYQHNIASGYPDGTFRPDQPVTYAEALKILVNLFDIDTQTASAGTTYGLQPSSDLIQYVHAAAQLSVLDAPETFDASTPAKRGYIAEIAHRLMQRNP